LPVAETSVPLPDGDELDLSLAPSHEAEAPSALLASDDNWTLGEIAVPDAVEEGIDFSLDAPLENAQDSAESVSEPSWELASAYTSPSGEPLPDSLDLAVADNADFDLSHFDLSDTPGAAEPLATAEGWTLAELPPPVDQREPRPRPPSRVGSWPSNCRSCLPSCPVDGNG
jgi:chemosensory pili system protein ChpA (sensor histidine kinase/response regulator)